ncbi:MAG: hypothetical protein JXB42_10350 [Deltaproteobacteria bacterium]|nr:hypothetical protein [Deltaproteobacteria bacterium]
MKVIKGNFQKNIWKHDRAAYSDNDIDFVNEALREAGQHDPRWLKLLWRKRKLKRSIRSIE